MTYKHPHHHATNLQNHVAHPQENVANSLTTMSPTPPESIAKTLTARSSTLQNCGPVVVSLFSFSYDITGSSFQRGSLEQKVHLALVWSTCEIF